MARPQLDITLAQRHTVATLYAAGLTRSHIQITYGISEHRVRRIMQEAGWPALLESKREALKALMEGRA